MKTENILLLLTKCPHRARLGPERWHDWRVSCRKALALQREYQKTVIYIPSAVEIAVCTPERTSYAFEFLRLGIHQKCGELTCRLVLEDEYGRQTVIERKGQETIEQIRLAGEFAKQENARLIVVSTWTHFLRVLYLCRGKEVTHHVAWGVPNPIEMCTDLILALVFPMLHLLGWDGRFEKWVIRRRKRGKHI